MRAALDAFWAGQLVADATREVAQIISSRSLDRTIPPAPISSHAPKPSSKDSRASRDSCRSRSRSSPQSPKVSRSEQAPILTSQGLMVIE